MTLPIAGGVDCDIHPAVPHLTSLLPHLGEYWRDQVITRVEAELRGNVPQVSHADDALSLDAHVGAEPGAPGAVHHPAVLDDQVQLLGSGGKQERSQLQGEHGWRILACRSVRL